MKQFLQVAGELITAGPSPLMKGWLVGQEAEGRPKQVAVGGFLEGAIKTTARAVDALVSYTDEPGPDDGTKVILSLGAGGMRIEPLPEEAECETFDEVRLACAAGVLPIERAFEIVKRLMSELESGADAARAEAESWKSQCAALSARVVNKFGGDLDGRRKDE
jgi:hypothetical protein